MNKDWLDIGVLEDYLDGKLDAKTMNRVEREALEDPFVAEALAGLSESPKRSLQSISLLQKQLHERVAQQQTVKKNLVITWQRLSIAATAAVMFVAVSIMFWMRENNHQKDFAGGSKKIEVTIAPKVPSQAPEVEVTKTDAYTARVKPKAALPKQVHTSELNDVAVEASDSQMKQHAARSVAGVLKTDSQSSDAIVTAGLAKRQVSNPVGGWNKFLEYIKENNRFEKNEKTGQVVELSFGIDKDGNPIDVKIVKGADHQYEQEAIRLMTNGPKWEIPQLPNSRMTLKIDF